MFDKNDPIQAIRDLKFYTRVTTAILASELKISRRWVEQALNGTITLAPPDDFEKRCLRVFHLFYRDGVSVLTGFSPERKRRRTDGMPIIGNAYNTIDHSTNNRKDIEHRITFEHGRVVKRPL